MRKRLLSLIRKEFIQIVRDPRTLGLTFLMPIVMLLLLGYAATNDVRNISLVVWDQDQSSASRALLDAYRAADYFRLDYYVGSEAEIQTLIDSNIARAGIIIPPDYGGMIASGRTAEVAFVIDGSDPTVANTALAAATMVGQSHATQLALQRMERRGQGTALQSALEVRPRAVQPGRSALIR